MFLFSVKSLFVSVFFCFIKKDLKFVISIVDVFLDI